ncbi:MAG: FtsX-like permease family protein [Clostridiales Family XIII bacterium]|nr:FtsX-like permease family protein [Clostridiales Family XIII bacterium]
MRSPTIRKLIFRDLRSSPGRFLAIFVMFALGAGFFAGLGNTAPSMRASADIYLHETRLADFRLISTYGWDSADVIEAAKLPGVESVMPRYSFTAKVARPDGIPSVFSIKSLPLNTSENSTSYLNRLVLKDGRLPAKSGECAVDAAYAIEIGDELTITDEIEGAEYGMIKTKTVTVVGKVDSPEYISYARGNSSLGNGEIDSFLYLPPAGMDSAYYTEICILMEETHGISAFSDAYKDIVDSSKDLLEDFALERAELRHRSIREEAEQYLRDGEADIATSEEELRDGQAEVDDGRAEANREFAKAKSDLQAGEQKLADGRAEYDKNATGLADGEAALSDAKAQVEQMKLLLQTLPPGPEHDGLAAQIAGAEAQIAQNETQLTMGRAALEEAAATLDAAAAELSRGWASYDSERWAAFSKLDDAQAEIDDGRTKIEDAKTDIAEARQDLDEMDEPEAFIFEREDNAAYSTFEPNAARIASLAATIPPFMFVIAALVCLTTMARLVEEHRTRIGTLKALGYGRGAIISIYLFYAIVCSLAGSVAGILAGINIFPSTIWFAYEGLYALGEFKLELRPAICLIALVAGVIVTVAATFASCYNEQRSPAAVLMRPRAPKAGKRVLLERATIIWKHLNFNQKVTMRNIFRYKKRLIMTIVGIAGCSALLLASFGIEDSIRSMADRQYEDIYHYNIYVMLKDDADPGIVKNELAVFGSRDSLSVSETSCTLLNGEINTNGFNTISAFVPEDAAELNEYILLRTMKGEPLSIENLSSGDSGAELPGVFLTDKLAAHMDVGPGDSLTIEDSDGNTAEAVVSGVTLNYVGAYVYMNSEAYENVFSKPPQYKSILMKLNSEYVDRVDEAVTEIMAIDGVEFAYSSSAMRELVFDIAENMDVVIMFIQQMSVMLAIVVLYNLININITEREREIATLKVLGYRPREVFLYFFSESSILTFIGALFGLLGGIVLHRQVINAIASEDASFPLRLEWGVLLLIAMTVTMLICVVVNTIMQPKLRRIDPVSSLKSPE